MVEIYNHLISFMMDAVLNLPDVVRLEQVQNIIGGRHIYISDQMFPGASEKNVLGTVSSCSIMVFVIKAVILTALIAGSADSIAVIAATPQHGKSVLLGWKGALQRAGALPATSRMHSWIDGSDMCYDWIGTFCNGDGQLDLLNLNGDGVVKGLPVELSQVTSLRSLLLAGNNFTGEHMMSHLATWRFARTYNRSM